MNAFSDKNDCPVNKEFYVIGPMVTVIIPTFNAGKNFAQLLEGLKTQTASFMER